MSWKDILKRDNLRDWFNNPSKRDKKRKKAFNPHGAYLYGTLQRQKYARNKWQGEKPTSRHAPESPKPEPTPKPKPPKPYRPVPKAAADAQVAPGISIKVSLKVFVAEL